MTATEITTIFGLVTTAIGTVAFPLYLNRRKNTQSDRHAAVLDSTAVARMMKEERDSLQLRLNTMQTDYEQRIATLKAENSAAIAEIERKYQSQITELRAEVDGLYRRLYERPAT